MRPLKDFFEKIKNTLLKDMTTKESIVFVIKKETGIEISTAHIVLIGKKIKISCHPAIKNEINLKKELILRGLQEKRFMIDSII